MIARIATAVKAAALVIGISLLAASSAAANTLNVPADYSTIQAAVNASSSGDTVAVAPGIYSGAGNVDIDPGGKNITIRSTGGAAVTIIDCQGSLGSNRYGFIVHQSETNVVIQGFTVQNGNGGSRAGGISVLASTAAVDRCVIKNCKGTNGGGFYATESGLHVHANLTVTNSTVIGCAVTSTGGGAYINASDATFNRCDFINNVSASAGGAYEFNDTTSQTVTNTLSACVFMGNKTTTSDGGAIDATAFSQATFNIYNCSFYGNDSNHSISGSGTMSFGSEVNVIKNCVFWGDLSPTESSTADPPASNPYSYCDVNQSGYAGANGNISADPLYLDPTHGNLMLPSNSPCYALGLASAAPATDHNNFPWPAVGPSMGAFSSEYFTVSAPTSAAAGTPFSVTVTAYNVFNSVQTDYAGYVSLSSTDAQAVLPPAAQLLNGVGIFSVTDKTAGIQTVAAVDDWTTSLSGLSGSINVAPGPIDHFVVTGPTTATAGSSATVSVTAYDAYGNLATNYSGTVHFTSTDGAAVLPADATLTNGVGTFSVTLKTAGSQTVSVTDTVNAAATGTTSGISVAPGSAISFTVSGPATAWAGDSVSVTVTAYDAYGNAAANYGGTVHFTSTDPAATLPADATLTNGVGTFGVTLQTVGSQTVSATDTVTTSLAGTSNAISVAASEPTTSAAISPSTPDGSANWYKTPVTVTLTPSDPNDAASTLTTIYTTDGSAPTSSATATVVTGAGPIPILLSSDGYHTVRFYSVDPSNNAQSVQSVSVKIDGTRPTLTFGTPSPAPNADGWNNTNVSWPYAAADATSGIGTATPGSPVTITGEGTGLSQTVTATDVAGNSVQSATPAVKIDLTKPVTLASTQSDAVGQTVTLTATDNLSGVASTVYSIDGGSGQPYTVPFTVSGNGDHTVTFHSVDKAGNAEDDVTVNFTVNIDAPMTTATLSGPQGDNGWYTGDVTVTLSPQAAGVAVGSTFYTIDDGVQTPYTGPFTVSGDAVHTVTYWSADTAGNAEAQNQLPVKIDGTAPTLTVGIASPAPNAAGWNNTPVTVIVSGTDALSGFAALDPAGPVTFTAAGKGQTQAVTGKDNAGNAASTSTPKVNIDLTAPTTTASPSGSANGDGSYTSAATVTLSASDDLSGVAATTYAIDGGTAKPYTQPFTVSGTGTHTVTFFSTDVAGNAEASKTLTVTVAAPPTPVLNTFSAGLQMIAVPESYGSASTALNPAPSKLAVWSPSLVQYTLLGASAPLAPGQGYWVRLGQSTDLYDNGTPTPPSQPFTLSLQKGWNMIGDPFKSAVNLSAVTVRNSAGKTFTIKDANLAGLISTTLYSYPAGSSAYQTTGADGSLAPYTGYWVYAFAACSLSIPAAQ